MRLLLVVTALAIPVGLDLYMPVPQENPITAQKVEQGRRLFFDRRLSRDESTSCSSCLMSQVVAFLTVVQSP